VVIDIPNIERDALFPSQRIAIIDLRQTGDCGKDIVSAHLLFLNTE
jgi:hypothetical protein